MRADTIPRELPGTFLSISAYNSARTTRSIATAIATYVAPRDFSGFVVSEFTLIPTFRVRYCRPLPHGFGQETAGNHHAPWQLIWRLLMIAESVAVSQAVRVCPKQQHRSPPEEAQLIAPPRTINGVIDVASAGEYCPSDTKSQQWSHPIRR
jgi:hypothetical protein